MGRANAADPITILENQDDRQRRDALKATRYVVNKLTKDELRGFLRELTALLRKYAPVSPNQDRRQQ